MDPTTRKPTTSRSAHATIRGYFWQFVVSCSRWLKLEEDDYLVCEGVEDIDIFRRRDDETNEFDVTYEQLKDYESKGISVGNKAGREVLGNFVAKYVEEVRQDKHPHFKLTTTTHRADQQGGLDVIKTWTERSIGKLPDDDFIEAIRAALRNAIKDLTGDKKTPPPRALEIQDALAWLDETQIHERWTGFLDAVEWSFSEHRLPMCFEQLVTQIEQLEHINLPCRQVAERLILELISSVSEADPEQQRFDKQRLNAILKSTREELDAWRSKHGFATQLFELVLEDNLLTQERLIELSKSVDDNTSLLKRLIKLNLLEASPFGLESDTPFWDMLKLKTRATLSSYPPVLINQNTPLSRKTVQDLKKRLSHDDTTKLFMLGGEGGSGKSTALVSCARELLDDPDTVVLLINLDHITAGTKLGGLVPNPKNYAPDQLLALALGETARKKGVLIIDQLDRLSLVSASSEAKRDYFAQINELIMRTLDKDNIRVLVACRSFDRETDPRMDALTNHSSSEVIEIGPLEEADVRRVVTELGYPTNLTAAQIELLSTPLHLHLLASLKQPIEEKNLIDEYQLYESFWRQKRRELQSKLKTGWHTLHENIYTFFLESGQRIITERDIGDDIEDVERLVSEGIFRTTDAGFMYFHQRYEEYVFARFFRGDIVDYIKGEQQSLLAVEQVKAILTERSHTRDRNKCVADLRALIFSDLQAHFRLLVKGVLATRRTIEPEEFELWLDMASSSQRFIANQARDALAVNNAFIDVIELDELILHGTCRNVSLNTDIVFNVRVSLLQHLFKHRPKEGAKWIIRLLPDEQHNGLLQHAIRSELMFSERVLFDAYLESIKHGLWDKPSGLETIYSLPETNVEWVPEVIAECVRRNLKRDDIKGRELLHSLVEARLLGSNDRNDPKTLVQRCPCEVVKHFTPLLPELLGRSSHLWWNFGQSTYLDIEDMWLNTLFSSLKACQNHDQRNLAAQISFLIPDTGRVAKMIRWRLILASNDDNLDRALQELIDMLCKGESLRLPDGYQTVFMLLYRAYENQSSEEWLKTLEHLLAYSPDGEYAESQRAQTLFPLLHALPAQALSSEAQARLTILQNSMDTSFNSLGPTRSQAGFINPIDDVDFNTFNDDKVIDYINHAQPKSTDFLHQPKRLATTLHASKHDPIRFLGLLEKRFDDIMDDAVIAILNGWERAIGEQDPNKRLSFSSQEWQQVFAVVTHTHQTYPIESARAIIDLLRLYDGIPALNIVKLVQHILTHHPDATTRAWETSEELYIRTINTVRGRSAELLGNWMLHDRSVFKASQQVLGEVCRDKDSSVRAGVGLMVLACLEHEPDVAIEYFIELVDSQPDALLGTRYITEFIRYGIDTHVVELSPIIKRMLESELDDVRYKGGIAWGLTTFVDKTRLESIPNLATNVSVARGLAQVWCDNLMNLSEGQYASLIEFFDHESDDVLKVLSGMFHNVELVWFMENHFLVDAYLNARVASINAVQFLYVLKNLDLVTSHPDRTLEILERLIEKLGKKFFASPGSSLDAYNVCMLLEQLFQEHPSTHARVLSIISTMVTEGSQFAEMTLRKLQQKYTEGSI